jgi:hypothetical protein
VWWTVEVGYDVRHVLGTLAIRHSVIILQSIILYSSRLRRALTSDGHGVKIPSYTEVDNSSGCLLVLTICLYPWARVLQLFFPGATFTLKC